MKQIAIVLFTVIAFISYAETTSWTGYLADQMCSDNLITGEDKAAGHTKECLAEDHCAKSGYGLIVDGKWYKFDKKGNELTAALLASTTKDKGIKVTVAGKMKKNKISVTSIVEAN